jgi:two-component system sensor histidine kinase DegS
VRIAVEQSARAIHVHVADDGHGFDPTAPGGGGFGLTGMRERVSLLRGDLEISSSAAGTTLAAAIPAP